MMCFQTNSDSESEKCGINGMKEEKNIKPTHSFPERYNPFKHADWMLI